MENEITGPLELDVDLSQVDTSFPVLVAGLKDLTVKAFTKEENKAKNGFNLVVELATTTADKTVTDADVPAGFVLKKWYPLQDKPGTTKPGNWKINLAAFQDACLGTTQGTRPAKFNTDDYLHRVVRANVTAAPGDNGRMQNSIEDLTHPV